MGKKFHDREGRAKHALGEMGISVINSAGTTLLAALMLFFCWFLFFVNFGSFIFIVILLSILMSVTFLIPLLLCFGPQNDGGTLPCVRRKAHQSEQQGVGGEQIGSASE